MVKNLIVDQSTARDFTVIEISYDYCNYYSKQKVRVQTLLVRLLSVD